MNVLRLADRVASAEVGDTVYAARLPDGPLVVLDGVSALIWRRLRDDADLDTLPTRVAAQLLDPPADLGTQIDAFVGMLRAHGLLVPPRG
jgi:hypothetical protein